MNKFVCQTNLDDQRTLLIALFRTQSFWWPHRKGSDPVINYLFRDKTTSESLTYAAELGIAIETSASDEFEDESEKNWRSVVKQHMYRLIVERISVMGKRPDTNKEVRVCVFCI
jgi:hypothetical protein